MSDAQPAIRRILLPLDLSRDSLAALNIAFQLAAALGGEISGLFIEDAALVAAGGLPFASEVGSHSGVRRRIGPRDMNERLRAIAQTARDAVADAASRAKVQSHFRVAQGDVTTEILTAASAADLIVLGRAGWSMGKLNSLGRTCLAVLTQSGKPVVLVEKGAIMASPVLAVNDGSDAGARAVELARRLGHILDWDIAVFVAKGMVSGDDVLEKTRYKRPHFIVLPVSLPLRSPSNLECPVLFVP